MYGYLAERPRVQKQLSFDQQISMHEKKNTHTRLIPIFSIKKVNSSQTDRVCPADIQSDFKNLEHQKFSFCKFDFKTQFSNEQKNLYE